MQGIVTLMIILIFIPVIIAIYILYKRIHEEPKDNKSREILLQAMCLEEIRKKKDQETTAVDDQKSDTHQKNIKQEKCVHDEKNEFPDLDDDTRKAMQIAKDSLYSKEYQSKNEEEANAEKKKAAADMVMNMMKNKGKKGASREELQEMINVLSDKNK